VLLETEEVIIRGALRARIPFASVAAAQVEGGRLILAHAGQRTILHLGSDAPRWAQRILNPKSRIEKLGVKPGMLVSALGLPDRPFEEELAKVGVTLCWGRVRKHSDLIFIGVEKPHDVTRLGRALSSLKPDGAIWAVHRKGKEGVQDTVIFSSGAALGLVSTKVVKFSETHTAEKLVIPLAKRKQPG
jgi:hypothetical protein